MIKNFNDQDYFYAECIAKAVYFTAHLRCGPTEKHTTRDIATYEEAVIEGERLTKAYSKFGREAMVYAVTPSGDTVPCTPQLVDLARHCALTQ